MSTNMNKLETYKKQIQADFPELTIQDLEFIGSGWDHDAVQVNDRLIFRLPKDSGDLELESVHLHYEVKALNYLRGRLPIEIPQPTHVSPSRSYFGYPKLYGVMIAEDQATPIELNRPALLQDWVKVSSQIHSAMPVETARLLGVPEDRPDFSLAQRFCSLPAVDKAVREYTAKVLADTELFIQKGQSLVFAHNDLRFQNMLLYPEATRIQGLIDWSDMSIAPIEKEFSSSSWSSEELVRAIALYPKSIIKVIDLDQVLRWRWLEDVSDFIELTDANNVDAIEILERLCRNVNINLS
ncbi:aminoglycoside phosphotransferase family protein [Leptospira biflexa]|uniref:phosphotransferase family protein n=1 Tax=Leptospira biflexa TaxID=172 RepID=UPI0010911E01|nr:aminoglycoside phosphotransferase family protein [Leptospira biflexa]TGM48089.1 aminoglycoside phosphotransferase family protein [Leptospira biflexa]TGM49446.1 aminoglycoside phosphotransferase family protein [Leptospira biflexa]